MKSKTSFFNKGILHNDFKRYSWISVVYLLGLLAAVPLQLVMIFSRPEEVKMNYSASIYLQVFQFDNSPLSLILLLIVPVLTGLLLFRYLQSSKAADMEHALPIRRETLYSTHIMAGVIFLFIPVIITALVSWAAAAGLGIDSIQSNHILTWLTVALLANLLFFLSTVAIGMFTGLSAVQGLLTYILLLVPTGLSMLVLYNLMMYVYGFPYDYFSANLDKFSPLLRLPLSNQPLPSGEITLYLLVCIALYFLGRYLYQKRKIEAAGDAITFEVLRPIFKYSVTFCSMLLIGSYFYSTQQSMVWTYFGYLLGAGLGYFLTEILLNKSLYVFQWQRFKGLGIYTLVIIGMIGLLYADCTGYEKRLPELSQVESVYMDGYFHPLLYGDDSYTGPGSQPYKAIYTEKDNIAQIHALHQKIVANREEEKGISIPSSNIRQERVCLAYQLKDGSRFCRHYEIASSTYKEQLKAIYESREYKTHHYEVLRVNPAAINLMEINSRDGNKNVRIADPELIKQALAVLQSDIYAQSYEEMTINRRPPWAQINFTVSVDKETNTNTPTAATTFDSTMVEPGKSIYEVNVSWQKSYANFERWLQSTGLYDQARLLPGEISYAIIDNAPDGMNKESYRRLMEAGNSEAKPEVLKITDPDKLELCLRNYRDDYTEEPVYTVYFKLKNGSTFAGIIPSAEAPDFVRQHFTR